MGEVTVHGTHCCKRCGCRYGDENCPVVLGTEESVVCEDCGLTGNIFDRLSKIDDVNSLMKLVEIEEYTLSVYRIGRKIIELIVPEELDKFPRFNYTPAQEYNLLVRLAELQKDKKTRIKYQLI